jgi:hypothetical protein
MAHKSMSSYPYTHRVAKRARMIVGLATLVAALPVALGSLFFALTAYVGFPSSLATLARWAAWMNVSVVLVVHLALVGTSTFLAVGALRQIACSTALWRGTAVALLAMCILELPSVSGDLFFLGYSWPATLATAILLGLSLPARSTTLTQCPLNDA